MDIGIRKKQTFAFGENLPLEFTVGIENLYPAVGNQNVIIRRSCHGRNQVKLAPLTTLLADLDVQNKISLRFQNTNLNLLHTCNRGRPWLSNTNTQLALLSATSTLPLLGITAMSTGSWKALWENDVIVSPVVGSISVTLLVLQFTTIKPCLVRAIPAERRLVFIINKISADMVKIEYKGNLFQIYPQQLKIAMRVRCII